MREPVLQARLGQERLGVLIIIASALAFSTAGFFTRLIDLDVWTVLFWRGLFGGLVIAAFIVWRHRRRTAVTVLSIGRAGLLVTLCSAIATICFINALRQTTVADVLVINAAAPFLTAALAWLWTSQRERKETIVASLVAFIGVVVMVSGAGSSGHRLGDCLALIMTILISAVMVIIRDNRGISMLPATGLSAFLCAGLVLPVATPGAARGMALFYLVTFGVQFGLGLMLLTIGTRMISATRSALIGSLETPLAPVWVWLAFDEVPTLSGFAGGLIVMMAVIGEALTEPTGDGFADESQWRWSRGASMARASRSPRGPAMTSNNPARPHRL
jgi:drug/metabolite transporter (DMT)-like permease